MRRAVKFAGVALTGDRIMEAGSPEDVKAIAPWVSASSASAKSSTQLATEGVCMPPFHFRCRTTVVSVSLIDSTNVGVTLPPSASPETGAAVATLSPREMQNKLDLMRAAPGQMLYVDGDRTRHASQHGTSPAQFGEPFSNPKDYQRSAVETIQYADVVLASAGPDGERLYHFIDTKSRRHTVATDGGLVVSHNGAAIDTDEEHAAWLAEMRRTHAEVAVRGEPTDVQDVHPEAVKTGQTSAARPMSPTTDAVVTSGAAAATQVITHSDDLASMVLAARPDPASPYPALRSDLGQELIVKAQQVFGQIDLPNEIELEEQVRAWVDGMTSEEAAGVAKWTRGGHLEVARGAMNPDPQNKKDRQEVRWADGLRSAMAKAPRVRGILFRGVDQHPLLNKAGEITLLSPGEIYNVVYIDAGSVDPTISANYAAKNDNGCLLIIVSSGSGRYVGTAAVERWRHLKETLLTEPGAFEIIDVMDVDLPRPDGTTVTRPVAFMKEIEPSKNDVKRERRGEKTPRQRFSVVEAMRRDLDSGRVKPMTDDDFEACDRFSNHPPYK